jgi:hypothetical protein
MVVPADQRLLARIAIGDAARREATHVRHLRSYRRSAAAPQRDEGAPERECDNTEFPQKRHSDNQRCKLLASHAFGVTPDRGGSAWDLASIDAALKRSA